MESRAKFLGHPVHPMLVVLPLGLFVAAVIFDAVFMWRGTPESAVAAFWNIAAGIIGGLLAAIFGAIDWWAIPRNTRAKQIGLIHGLANLVVVLLFAWVWLTRCNGNMLPSDGVFGLEVIALIIGAVSGWLGGELVDRLGVGVHDGAHLNAPSSLGGHPVRTR